MVERWYGVVPLVDLAARLGVTPRNLQGQAWRWGISGKMNRWIVGAPPRDADKWAEGWTLARLERKRAA
jgi:hypothetical protein